MKVGDWNFSPRAEGKIGEELLILRIEGVHL